MGNAELVIKSIESGLRLKRVGMESRLLTRSYGDGLIGERHVSYEMNELFDNA